MEKVPHFLKQVKRKGMEYQGRLFGKVGGHYFPLLATSEDFDKLKKERDELLNHLREAKLQIEYLHDKFQETGSGNAVIFKIDSLLKSITQ